MPSAGRGRKKSKRLKQPPPFDCAVSEWSAPTPQEAAEIDLGADYCDFERLDEPPTHEQFVETIWSQLKRVSSFLYAPFTSTWLSHPRSPQLATLL